MTPHIGVLYRDAGFCVSELINHARTLAYLPCTRNGVAFSVVADEHEALLVDPCTGTTQNFTTPDSLLYPAPWYSSPHPQSARAWGFWIEEWTGLGSGNITRDVRSRLPRGSSFGTMQQPAKTWKLNVLLFGADGAALEWLFRWLEAQLMDCCDAAGGLWLRTSVPESGDVDNGLVGVSDVRLIEGLEWIEPPSDDMAGVLRRATFTLGIGDPCYYSMPESLVETSGFAAVDTCTSTLKEMLGSGSCGDIRSDWKVCAAVGALPYGSTAPVVTLTNSGPLWSPPVTVGASADPLGKGCSADVLALLGSVTIVGVPPKTTVTVDCARRRVLTCTGLYSGWTDSPELLDGTSSITWPAVGDCAGLAWVQPAMLADSLNDLTVAIDTVTRTGCC